MRESNISTFMLERYRLGELLPEDKKSLEGLLPFDGVLRSRLEALDESDRELRLSLPYINFDASIDKSLNEERLKALSKIPKINVRVSLLVAASLLCVLMPVLYFAFLRNGNEQSATVATVSSQDRAKGSVLSGVELSLFLKGNQEIAGNQGIAGNQEIALENQTMLGVGDTVQLAYTTAASGPSSELYGVIFSIDGRSVVTMHYPYRKGQNPLLVSGKRIFLEEAYTLDDAPGYEVFVLVVSSQALDVEALLSEAQKIASNSEEAQFIEESSKAAFYNCEVDTVTVLKK